MLMFTTLIYFSLMKYSKIYCIALNGSSWKKYYPKLINIYGAINNMESQFW